MDGSAELSQLQELVEYLSHANPLVKIETLNILTRISTDDWTIHTLVTLHIIKLLKQLLLSNKETVDVKVCVLKYMINLSENDTAANNMIHNNTMISQCYDYITTADLKSEETCRYIELYILLLCNITRTLDGINKLLQVNTSVYSLHFLRLLNRYFIETDNDIYAHIGYICSNISTVEPGRNLLCDPQRNILDKLKHEVNSSNPVRRLATLTTLKNLFIDKTKHQYLLSDSLDLYTYIVTPIVGSEPLNSDTDHTELVPVSIQRMIESGHQRDTSVDCRRLSLDIINICAHNKYSRVIFRNKQIYPLLRELHKYEEVLKPADYDTVDALITELVTDYFLQKEADDTPLIDTTVEDDSLPPLIDVTPVQNDNNGGSKHTNQNDSQTHDSDDDIPPLVHKPPSETKEEDLSFLDYL